MKKITACLLALIMLLSVMVVSPVQTKAATQSDLLLTNGEISYQLKVGDEVRIKKGAKDYYGADILPDIKYIKDLVYDLDFVVTAIDGDKVTIETNYNLGPVSYNYEVEMNIADLKYDVPAPPSDSDSQGDGGDTQIVYVPTTGSVVMINSGAVTKEGETVKKAALLFQYKVTSMDGTYANIETKISLNMLEDMGLSAEDLFDALPANLRDKIKNFEAFLPLLGGIGYSLKYTIDRSYLTLISGGVPSVQGSSASGVYKANGTIKATASYYDENGTLKSESVNIPKDTLMYIMVNKDKTNKAYVDVPYKDPDFSLTYYDPRVISNIPLDSCSFQSQAKDTFYQSQRGLVSLGMVVQVGYAKSVESFEGLSPDLFKSGTMSNGYNMETFDSEGRGIQYSKKFTYKITELLGNAVRLELTDNWMYDDNGIQAPTGVRKLIIPVKALRAASGTYSVKRTTDIYSFNGGKIDFNKKIGEYTRNTLMYIEADNFYNDNDKGTIGVRCNNVFGNVKVEDLQYVSPEVMYYDNNIRVGSKVKLKPTATKGYTGSSLTEYVDDLKAYFGPNYMTEMYNAEYYVTLAYNDCVYIDETEESENERRTRLGLTYVDQQSFCDFVDVEDLMFMDFKAGTYKAKNDIEASKTSTDGTIQSYYIPAGTEFYIPSENMLGEENSSSSLSTAYDGGLVSGISFADIEFVSEEVTTEAFFAKGDTVYIMDGIADDYINDLTFEQNVKNCLGSDFDMSELYSTPFIVTELYNDYAKLMPLGTNTRARLHMNVYDLVTEPSIPFDPDTDTDWDTSDTDTSTDTSTDTDKPEPVKVLYGDADLNGSVEMADVTHIQKALAEFFTLKNDEKVRADVDGNGRAELADVVLIQQYKAQLIKNFPVENNTSVG